MFTSSLRTADGERIHVEMVDALALDDTARARQRADMLAINRVAFQGSEARMTSYLEWITDPEQFGRYQRTVLFRAGGALIAYVHAFVQVIEVETGPVELIRVSASTLPTSRTNGLIARGYLQLASDFARRHFITRMPRYYTGVVLSPIMYGMMGRRTRRLFPSPGPGGADPELKRMYQAIHGEGGLVAEPVSAFETAAVHAKLQASTCPYIRFYLDTNPRFAEGFGLPVLVPVNGGDLLYALAASAGLQVARRVRWLRVAWVSRGSKRAPRSDFNASGKPVTLPESHRGTGSRKAQERAGREASQA